MRDLLNKKDRYFHEYKHLFKHPEATYLEDQVQRQNLLISLKSAILSRKVNATNAAFPNRKS